MAGTGRQKKQTLLMVLWLTTCIFTISSSSASRSSGVGDKNISFTYNEGKGKRGPKEWGSLSPKWRACGDGKLQSPIDLLIHGVEVSPELGNIQIHYKPSLAAVINSGHDIMTLHDMKKTRKGGKDRNVGIVNPKHIKFGSKKYYRYVGSLTTPPCTEGVVWTIVKKVRTASRAQIKALQKTIYKGFKNNARPTQNSNGRLVQLYN